MNCKCCDNTKDLGCVENCGIQFVTGASVPVGDAGEWILYIEFNRRLTPYRNTLVEGQAINFLIGCLNFYYNYRAYIVKPNGDAAVFEIAGNFFDCFTFSTTFDSAAALEAGATAVQ
jgi:hypothetical protein